MDEVYSSVENVTENARKYGVDAPPVAMDQGPTTVGADGVGADAEERGPGGGWVAGAVDGSQRRLMNPLAGRTAETELHGAATAGSPR